MLLAVVFHVTLTGVSVGVTTQQRVMLSPILAMVTAGVSETRGREKGGREGERREREEQK